VYIERLNQLLVNFRAQYGVNHADLRKHSCVVSTDGAVGLMREVAKHVEFKLAFYERIEFDSDDDSLFLFDGVRVVLRHRATPGHAFVVETTEVPKRDCCDSTAFQTLMIAMSTGSA
jgi:hypothetical protein